MVSKIYTSKVENDVYSVSLVSSWYNTFSNPKGKKLLKTIWQAECGTYVLQCNNCQEEEDEVVSVVVGVVASL